MFGFKKNKIITPLADISKEIYPPESWSSVWYKCRNCGEEFHPAKCLYTAADFVVDGIAKSGQYPSDLWNETAAFIIHEKAPHNCSENCWSIGDFLRISKDSAS